MATIVQAVGDHLLLGALPQTPVLIVLDLPDTGRAERKSLEKFIIDQFGHGYSIS
jgi:hypothetical protein